MSLCNESAEPTPSVTLVMDHSLLRVAKNLRLMGFDVLCSIQLPTEAIIPIAVRENRVLVTSSRRLAAAVAKCGGVELGRCTADSATIPRGERRMRRVLVGYNSEGESE